MKKLFLIGLVLLIACIAINQYTEVVPDLLLARSSRIIEDKGHCLRISKRRQEDLYHSRRPGGVVVHTFKMKVKTAGGSFDSLLTVNDHMNAKAQLTYHRNIKAARQHCSHKETSIGLIRFVATDKKRRENPLSKCASSFRVDRGDVKYMKQHDDEESMIVSCPVRSPVVPKGVKYNCSARFLYSDWRLRPFFPKDKLQYWKNAVDESKHVFDQLFKPMKSCPIRIPII